MVSGAGGRRHAVSCLERLVKILFAAEDASAGGVATLDFLATREPSVIGSVIAEDGRICWALAQGQRPSISDLLAEELGVAREQLEEIFVKAQAAGRPFGEEVVSQRLANQDDVRRCLRRQTVTALTALCATWDGDTKQCSTTRAPGVTAYDPKFTMAGTELLLECRAQPALQAEGGEPPPDFRGLAAETPAAICFLETGADDLPLIPVASHNTLDMTVGAALAIGREALAVVRPPALLAAGIEPFGVLAHHDGLGIVCARRAPYVCVFETADRSHYSKLAAHLLANPHGEGRAPTAGPS